jgi:hypothetical protein
MIARRSCPVDGQIFIRIINLRQDINSYVYENYLISQSGKDLKRLSPGWCRQAGLLLADPNPLSGRLPRRTTGSNQPPSRPTPRCRCTKSSSISAQSRSRPHRTETVKAGSASLHHPGCHSEAIVGYERTCERPAGSGWPENVSVQDMLHNSILFDTNGKIGYAELGDFHEYNRRLRGAHNSSASRPPRRYPGDPGRWSQAAPAPFRAHGSGRQ